jgi:ABC-type bacteriocin/lantibiotic exporter with double-glycine peptidase domain
MFLKTNLKLFSVLERKQKIRIGYFGFFLIVIMFLETFSFGMFYPFLQSITNNSINADFTSLLNYFKNTLNINLSIELTALLIFTSSIIIKNLFLFFFEFWSLTLLRDLRLDFKSKILKNHFQDDYEKISNIKTSVYIRDFNGTVDTFIRSLQSTMLLIIEFAVFLSLVGLLIFIQSKETIFFVLVLGFIGISFAFVVNNILKKYGAQNLYLQERSMNKLLDILNSTKEIIMLNKSTIFTKQFIKFQFKDLTIKRSVNLIQKFPKIFFEIVVVVGFTIYIFFLSLNGDDLNKIIPELGVFFLAIIRILPALSKIILHANKLKHAEVAAVKISDDIKNYNKFFSNKKSLSEIEFKDHLKLKKISFNYRNRDKKILEEVDFSINKNDYIGITGESGGGKSTLIDIISGLLIPNSGVITIDGKETKNLQSTNWIDKVGYLTQKNNLLDESIFTNITLEFNKDNIDKKLINEVFDKTGLRELINSLPEGIDTLIGENGFGLSGGERQRIGIARLLYAKKEILIFDESTSNLDHKNKEKFIKTINQLSKEKTIIIISHDESVIKNCKIKYIVKEKKLIKIN